MFPRPSVIFAHSLDGDTVRNTCRAEEEKERVEIADADRLVSDARTELNRI